MDVFLNKFLSQESNFAIVQSEFVANTHPSVGTRAARANAARIGVRVYA